MMCFSIGNGTIKGWVVQTLTEGSDRPDALLAKVVVLSAGLSCVGLLNPLLPLEERLTAYYSKGEYKWLIVVMGRKY
jgi:2-hydroxyglutarate dehydrogenase